MGWKLLQVTIFAAVMVTNIEWQWTPNGYLASLVALGAAFACTVALSWVLNTAARAHRLFSGRAARR
jgi:hypothetical protein